jgi:hypothetical protein
MEEELKIGSITAGTIDASELSVVDWRNQYQNPQNAFRLIEITTFGDFEPRYLFSFEMRYGLRRYAECPELWADRGLR